MPGATAPVAWNLRGMQLDNCPTAEVCGDPSVIPLALSCPWNDAGVIVFVDGFVSILDIQIIYGKCKLYDKLYFIFT